MRQLVEDDHNVLFITLDSCRYDSFVRANTPNMDKIGIGRLAYTHADYTLPAHMSFFSGHLPRLTDDTGVFNGADKSWIPVWRMSDAKKISTKVGVILSGNNILEGYRNKGFSVYGFGGVEYFRKKGGILRSLFKCSEFKHFSINIPDNKYSWEYPRSAEDLPFNHVDEIVQVAKRGKNWFIFINANETHWPYQTGIQNDNKLNELIEYSFDFRGGRVDLESKFNYENGGFLLHKLQVKAVEFIDFKLGQILDNLPNDKPIIVVICGDHGESFGESGRWGHIFNSKEVFEVPLLININYKHKKN